VAVDLGSLHDVCRPPVRAEVHHHRVQDARRRHPGAASGTGGRGYPGGPAGITALAKNRAGSYRILTNPTVALPSSIGVRREPDTRFREVVDAWIQMNRGIGQIREWMIQGILKSGRGRRTFRPS